MDNISKQRWSQVKLIVCDLDGTLLTSQKRFAPATIAAFEAARRAGLYVTFASGRIHPMLDAYVSELSLDCPVITTNGGVIIDAKDKSVLYKNTLTVEQVEPFLEKCAAAMLDYCVLCFDGSYFAPNSRRITRFQKYNAMAAENNHPPIPLHYLTGEKPFAVLEGKTISKLLVTSMTEGDLEAPTGWLADYPHLEYTNSDIDLLDVMNKGVDKGRGVAELCRLLNLSTEQACVFGDYDNDLPMFETAGLAVAMGNAPAEVQAQADCVCPTNDEDGVAYTITRYILGA